MLNDDGSELLPAILKVLPLATVKIPPAEVLLAVNVFKLNIPELTVKLPAILMLFVTVVIAVGEEEEMIRLP